MFSASIRIGFEKWFDLYFVTNYGQCFSCRVIKRSLVALIYIFIWLLVRNLLIFQVDGNAIKIVYRFIIFILRKFVDVSIMACNWFWHSFHFIFIIIFWNRKITEFLIKGSCNLFTINGIYDTENWHNCVPSVDAIIVEIFQSCKITNRGKNTVV